MTNRVVADTKTGSSVQFSADDYGKIYFNPIKCKSIQTVTTANKQLFDKAKVGTVKYINPNTGVLTTSSYNNNVSALIAVTAGQSVTISGHTFVQPNTPVGLAWYGPTGTYISGVSYQNATGNGTYLAPAGTAWVRDTVNNVDLNTSQMEIGTVATPYVAFVPTSPSLDYPAPITSTGDGGSFVAVACGKNQFDGILESGTISGTTGQNASHATQVRSKNYIAVKSNVQYSINQSSYTRSVFYYASDKSFISQSVLSSGNSIFSTPSNCCYIKFIILTSTTDLSLLVQVELGTTATPYEAYKGNTITVNSGGYSTPDVTADVIDLPTKKKTANCAKVVLSGGVSEIWGLAETSTNTLRFRSDISWIGIKLETNPALDNNLLSDKLKVYSQNYLTSTDTEGISTHPTNGIQIRINKSRLSTLDVAGLKSYLATNLITIIYKLATPVTTDITVTPSNYLTSYKGITNVFTTDATQPIFTATLNMLVYDIQRYLNLITSEHSNKPKYMKFIEYLLRYIDLTYLNIDQDFDIDSAVGNQLDIIGTILGLSRKLNFQPSGGTSSILTDSDYRSLLKSKIILNQWNGSMETLSDALSNWSSTIYFTIKDNQDMTVDISVVGATQLQKELISNGYVIPKPAGVKINYSMSSSVIFAYDSSTSTLAGYDTGTWL